MDEHTQIELIQIWKKLESGAFDVGVVVDLFRRLRELIDRSHNGKSKVLELGDFLAHWQERTKGHWSGELTNTVKDIEKKRRIRKLLYKPWTDIELLEEVNQYFRQAGVQVREQRAGALCGLLFPKLLDTRIRLRNLREVVLGINYDQAGKLHLGAMLEQGEGVYFLPIISASCELFAKDETEFGIQFRPLQSFYTWPPSVGRRTKLTLDLVRGKLCASQEGLLIQVDFAAGDQNDQVMEHAIVGVPYQRMFKIS